MKPKQNQDVDETAQRRDDALRRALNTLPKPQDQMKLENKKKPKPSAKR
jgi:hypothetical protein